jgi:hypothetical protein
MARSIIEGEREPPSHLVQCIVDARLNAFGGRGADPLAVSGRGDIARAKRHGIGDGLGNGATDLGTRRLRQDLAAEDSLAQ